MRDTHNFPKIQPDSRCTIEGLKNTIKHAVYPAFTKITGRAIFRHCGLVCLALSLTGSIMAQDVPVISGKVADSATGRPLPSVTLHLSGSGVSALTRVDGTFILHPHKWSDSLSVSIIGYGMRVIRLTRGHISNLVINLQPTPVSLETVTVSVSKRSGQSFMEKVIRTKKNNDPSRFHSYSYRRYSRNELDLDHVDFDKVKKNGLQGMLASVYSSMDSDARQDKELPLYFSETISSSFHSVSPHVEKDNLLARKSLGLKTDALLQRLEKFSLYFNVYDNWLPVFDQTYASPLNDNAFHYYRFSLGDTMVDNGNRLTQVRFTPLNPYERAFIGMLWIDDSSLAVVSMDMHIPATADLNFIQNINYHEEYAAVPDSATGTLVSMPSSYSSEVRFEAGLSLLGLPVPDTKESLHLITSSTTKMDRIRLGTGDPASLLAGLTRQPTAGGTQKTDSYWEQNRPEPLSDHEKDIYRMVDSLKDNRRFQRDIRLIAFAGTGYWDFDHALRIGPYTSFLSHNPVEGYRMRVGFWTQPGISQRWSFYGYGAYGTRDTRIKGALGIKYVWNERKWSKTTLWAGSDYDFIIDQHDELDKDNFINSFLRKHIPFTRTYIRQLVLNQEQYLNADWSLFGGISYRELNPVFYFRYNPINPDLDQPIDSITLKILPTAEGTIGLRYAHQERTSLLNYDRLRLGSFYPIVTFGYIHGFELKRVNFSYDKLFIGVEQKLRLPPKSLLYYRVSAGKIFGRTPYLLLNIPVGNEYYASSKYAFNMMTPYEFAADRYIGVHTRLSLGGLIFDKIPLLQKLGWRETLSVNGYWGDMTDQNKMYNSKGNFNLADHTPYAEGAIGIENIFHLFSVDYYRRFTHLHDPYAKSYGFFIGLHFMF